MLVWKLQIVTMNRAITERGKFAANISQQFQIEYVTQEIYSHVIAIITESQKPQFFILKNKNSSEE